MRFPTSPWNYKQEVYRHDPWQMLIVKRNKIQNPYIKCNQLNMKSILEEADKIVNNRSEEADRQYGPFSEGMDRAAMIFNGMTGLNVTGREMFMALIALKFSRESDNHKRDNLLDAVAYIQGLENYINESKD